MFGVQKVSQFEKVQGARDEDKKEHRKRINTTQTIHNN